MTNRQRENAAKYLYDISKGIALVTVVGTLTTGQASLKVLLLGFVGTIAFYVWAYVLDGGTMEGLMTPFELVLLVLALVGLIGAGWTYYRKNK